jgi:hypothetical protein
MSSKICDSSIGSSLIFSFFILMESSLSERLTLGLYSEMNVSSLMPKSVLCFVVILGIAPT